MGKLLAAIVLFFMLVACGNSKPKPETTVKVVPITAVHQQEPAVMEVMSKQNQQEIHIQYQVKGHDVYIECYIPHFSFQKNKRKNVNGEGHLHLYLNGKMVDEITTAAFILKGLPAGKHTLKVEMVHNDSTTYHISKEVEVSIPNK
jgi:uncharacterized lipoprotein YajG